MLCAIGKNTRETVLEKFKLNNLIGQEPTTEGGYIVLKPEEFDQANLDMSNQVLAQHNIANRFWVREGNYARFNNTFAQLVDVVDARDNVVSVRPTMTTVPSTREVRDEVTGDLLDSIPTTNFDIKFTDGASSFGVIEGNEARIAAIAAATQDSVTPVRGTKTFERVIKQLIPQGVTTIRVSMQSKDSRIALSKLVDKGILTNPRVMKGISTDTYPTVFDITSVTPMQDPAYHGGNLKEKSDYLTRGYYGEQPFTGYYFFSDRGRAESRGNRAQSKNNQVSEIDFSKYKLLKPTTVGYWNLKSSLKKIVNALSKGASMKEILDPVKFSYNIGPNDLGSYDLYNALKEKIIEVEDAFSSFQNYTQGQFEKVERFETTILKIAGYQGIDVRGLPEAGGLKSPDTGGEGSVIFDLKPGTYTTPTETIESPDLPNLTIPEGWVSPC